MIPYHIICELFIGDRRCLRTDRCKIRAKEDIVKLQAEYDRRFSK